MPFKDFTHQRLVVEGKKSQYCVCVCLRVSMCVCTCVCVHAWMETRKDKITKHASLQLRSYQLKGFHTNTSSMRLGIWQAQLSRRSELLGGAAKSLKSLSKSRTMLNFFTQKVMGHHNLLPYLLYTSNSLSYLVFQPITKSKQNKILREKKKLRAKRETRKTTLLFVFFCGFVVVVYFVCVCVCVCVCF